jgi:hypothetical protein
MKITCKGWELKEFGELRERILRILMIVKILRKMGMGVWEQSHLLTDVHLPLFD